MSERINPNNAGIGESQLERRDVPPSRSSRTTQSGTGRSYYPDSSESDSFNRAVYDETRATKTHVGSKPTRTSPGGVSS